eukprot:GHVT01016922.1.p1 GENE.GHVT01016922.1~~GHVT01016922.1.p1  ORF type:complete len:673 (+),score=108.98 GHVT01016922.1:262-2280(+)
MAANSSASPLPGRRALRPTDGEEQNLLARDGPVLKWLQLSGVDEDQKDVVDRPQRSSNSELLCAFGSLQSYKTNGKWATPPPFVLRQMRSVRETHFAVPGETVANFSPDDAPKGPLCFVTRTQRLSPPQLLLASCAAKALPRLCRRWAAEKAATFKADTHLPLPHPFVVPGGRFRELYYWDSYWVIRGLLLSGMTMTATSMLKCFAFLIDTLGFIPNASRAYYLDRSQPPLFFAMVDSVFRATQDLALLRRMVPRVAREHCFWMRHRAVAVVHCKGDHQAGRHCPLQHPSNAQADEGFILNRYNSFADEPRPESYRTDYILKSEMARACGGDEESARRLMTNIRAAAESGWDFSSRWMRSRAAAEERPGDEIDAYKGMLDINTTNVLPVDLNSLMYLMEIRLAEWTSLLAIGEGPLPVFPPGQQEATCSIHPASSAAYRQAAARRKEAMQTLMFDGPTHTWRDYLLAERRQSAVLSAAGIWPLWAGLMDEQPEELQACAHAFTLNERLWTPKGIACTTEATGQQWDFPNTWPPIAQIVLETFLTKPVRPEEVDKAKNMVDVYLVIFERSVTDKTGFYEKYSVAETSDPTTEACAGGGGEYPCQKDFAWTIAVALEFLYWKSLDFHLDVDEFLGRRMPTCSIIDEAAEDEDEDNADDWETPQLNIQQENGAEM